MPATIKSQGRASPPRSGQTLHVSQRVGATHRVALGHSCQHARSCPRQSNRKAGPRPTVQVALGHSVHARDNQIARQCLAPTVRPKPPCVPTRRGDPLGRPRSFMPTRSFMPGTNKSQGRASGWWASPDEGEALPRPHGPAKRSMCPNVGAHGRGGSPSVIHANTLVHARDNQIARQGLAPTVRPNAPCVPTRRGDPLGRPRSFMPTRSFMPATIKSQGTASPPRSRSPSIIHANTLVHARDKQIARQCLAPTVRPKPPCVPT